MKLKEMRNKAGFTAAQVADRLSVAVTTVFRWEGESRNPSLGQLVTMANLYGCSVDDLLGVNPSVKLHP